MLNWNCDDLFHMRAPGTKPREIGAVTFVDPGLEGTGIARWYDLVSPSTTPTAPYDVCAITPPRELAWPERIEYVLREWEDWLSRHHTDRVVLESQGVWMDSATSTASASSGSLLKLVMLTGGMMESCRRSGPNWGLVAPSTWKGQLPKSAMHQRIIKALGQRYPEHVADAVGMGLAAQGRL